LKFENRILRKLHSLAMKFIHRFWFWDDEAQNWGKFLIPFAEKLIVEKGLEVVVCTGHPFQANVAAMRLKERNPKLKLIQDLRDLWVKDPVKKMTASQKKALLKLEQSMIETADAIVSVTPLLLKGFVAEIAQQSAHLIYNGFDPDDIQLKTSLEKRYDLVHLGSAFCCRDEPALRLAEVIQAQKLKIKVLFVGAVPRTLKQACQSLVDQGLFKFIDEVPQKEALQYLSQARFGLQLNARIYPDALSTKLFEYVAAGIPVLSLNYGGDIDEVIRRYHFGYSLNPDSANFAFDLKRILEMPLPSFYPELTPFSFETLASEYSQLITSL